MLKNNFLLKAAIWRLCHFAKLMALVCCMFLGFTQTLTAETSVGSIDNLHLPNENTTPSLKFGASVYMQSCALCHGPKGAGDGVVAKKLTFYPSTDLRKAKHAVDKKSTQEILTFGGTQTKVSKFMPPMGNELSWNELESVVLFVELLRKDYRLAANMLSNLEKSNKVSRRLGQQIFKSRCVLCHGKYGEGDGRMKKVLKNPPPFDLTASRQSDEYLKKIITYGGESVSRSKHMPPWGDELSPEEIESVIVYLKTIRD